MKNVLSLLLALFVGVGAGSAQQAARPSLAERLGYPADARLLIVHADDIGVAHSVNAATFAAFDTGLVNSGSIMVPCPWLKEVAAYAQAHPDADLGLHLTLTSEWKVYRWDAVLPPDQVPGLHDADGYLHAATRPVAEQADPAGVERELRAQVERALAMGLQPTHLDSHMGALFNTRFFEAYRRVGQDYGLPIFIPGSLLAQNPALAAMVGPDDPVIDHVVMAGPDVPAEGWADFYADALRNLPPGVSEVIIHLAYDDPEMQAVALDHPDYGSAWRQRDFDYFTSEAFRTLLAEENIQLITWREIGRLLKR